MSYQYKMLQVPQIIKIKAKDYQGGEAAAYLEQIVTQEAREGWEFYRVDTIGVYSQAGCIASLFGSKDELSEYYVVTFRKEK
ncbi:MAG: DUF4177 domain-containing protein [Candidatus Aminicenantes bacterium]|nr:DUF4177 domain-containing protein [Candidatus Aminicenantes bacterium]